MFFFFFPLSSYMFLAFFLFKENFFTSQCIEICFPKKFYRSSNAKLLPQEGFTFTV